MTCLFLLKLGRYFCVVFPNFLPYSLVLVPRDIRGCRIVLRQSKSNNCLPVTDGVVCCKIASQLIYYGMSFDGSICSLVIHDPFKCISSPYCSAKYSCSFRFNLTGCQYAADEVKVGVQVYSFIQHHDGMTVRQLSLSLF